MNNLVENKQASKAKGAVVKKTREKKATRDHIRVQICIAYKKNPEILTKELAELLGLATTRAVDFHINMLRKEGMIVPSFRGTKERLTPQGAAMVKYVLGCHRGESFYHRTMRTYFPVSHRGVTTKIRDLVHAMDYTYQIERTGFVKFDGLKQKYILDRKVSNSEIVRAAKEYPMIWQCAGSVGLSNGAFEQRLFKLFARVHLDMCDVPDCKICVTCRERKV